MILKIRIRAGYALLAIALLVVIQSCYKDPFDLDKLAKSNITPDMAVPAVHSRLTLLKLLDVGSLTYTQDANKFLTLLYSDTIFSKYGNELFEFKPQAFDTLFAYPLATSLMPGDTVTRQYNFVHPLKTDGSEDIDSVVFREATYSFKITSTIQESSLITILIPNLVKDGQAFQKTFPFNYLGGPLTTLVMRFSLAGYTYVFDKIAPGTVALSEFVSIQTFISQTPTSSTPRSFSIRKEIDNVEFEALYGYLGQKDNDLGSDKFNISIFDNNVSGSAFLEDPRLNIHFHNSFGMPVKVEFPKLEVYRDGVTLPVGPVMPNLIINAPSMSQIGEYVKTTYTFDRNNSNIKDAINLMPKQINYHITAQSNPTGMPIPNFCLNQSNFYAVVETELPLYGRALNYTLRDTTNFTFEDDPNIIFAEMHINALSQLPAEAKIQIFFADSINNKLDSLFSEPSFVIRAASPGPPPDYRVTIPQKNSVTIRLERAKLDRLKGTKKLFVVAYVSTANATTQSIKLYSDYYIDVNVGVRLKYNVEF